MWTHPDDEAIKEAVTRCTNVYAQLANEKFGCKITLPVPVNFDLCKTNPKYGGMAHSFPSYKISYNHVLARENIEDFLNQTVPHEVAHLGAHSKFSAQGFPIDGHGPEWRELMRRFGLDPKKYHAYNVEPARAAQREYKKAAKEQAKLLAKLLKKTTK